MSTYAVPGDNSGKKRWVFRSSPRKDPYSKTVVVHVFSNALISLYYKTRVKEQHSYLTCLIGLLYRHRG